jgi:hypothetical protein
MLKRMLCSLARGGSCLTPTQQPISGAYLDGVTSVDGHQCVGAQSGGTLANSIGTKRKGRTTSWLPTIAPDIVMVSILFARAVHSMRCVHSLVPQLSSFLVDASRR